jgi:ElaA protein
VVTVRSRGFEDLDARTAYDVWRLRQDVFVVEQECPYPDLDGHDVEPGTRHLTLEVDGELAGYLRILDDPSTGSGTATGTGTGTARIGRVLLARAFRGRGLADRLMEAALEEIGDRPSRLDAQVPLAGWYASYGYLVTGPEFLDDGIPHVPMARPG